MFDSSPWNFFKKKKKKNLVKGRKFVRKKENVVLSGIYGLAHANK